MIEILQPPGLATVQDLGRPGLRAQGIPSGGALDRWSLQLANTIVGNEPHAAGIEWLLGGGRIRFLKPMPFALVGAEVVAFLESHHTLSCSRPVAQASLPVNADTAGTLASSATPRGRPEGAPHEGRRFSPSLRPTPIRTNRLAFARAGDELHIAGLVDSDCLYLALGGGLQTAPVLGSRATLLAAGLGGFEGRRLAAGDRLPTGRRRWPPPRFEPRHLAGCPWLRAQHAIRIVPGPQWSEFGGDWQEAFCTVDFTVGRDRDRAGMRLQSPLPPPALSFTRPSEPVAPGAIQILPTGQPIVILADGPTVGGYPKIGTVVTADLGRLAHLRAGATVRFTACPVEEAITALRESDTWLRMLRHAVRSEKPMLPEPIFE